MHIIICGYYGLKLIEKKNSVFSSTPFRLVSAQFGWFRSVISQKWCEHLGKEKRTQFKIVVAITRLITNGCDSSDAMGLFFFSFISSNNNNSAKRIYRISRFAIFFTLFLLPIFVVFFFQFNQRHRNCNRFVIDGRRATNQIFIRKLYGLLRK